MANTIADMKSQVRRALRVKGDAASDPYAEDLEASVELYLRSKAEDFDVTKNIQVSYDKVDVHQILLS